ncbi:MAG: 3-phosphoshikimate 1-carboxyvinyltransferase [Candidatus Hydrothermarchaeaceae archaeon]
MKAIVEGASGIGGTVAAPPSKSYTHRAFVIASLAEGESVIESPLLAGDTLSTLNAMRAFGVKIEEKGDIIIHGSGGALETPKGGIDCGNSGTTIRLVSGVAALDGVATLTGDESVKKRPMQPLLDALEQLGVRASSSNGTPPVVIEGGGIKGGEASIRGDVSSQFISSLLIVAPYAEKDVRIKIITPLKSRPYVDMTLHIMKKFGIEAGSGREILEIKAGQMYRGTKYCIEGDYSSAAYFFALAALTGSEITVQNLESESKQADRLILDILTEMGAKVTVKDREVTVKGNGLTGIEVDLGNAPDLLPTVAALGCRAEGETQIKNVEHARYKETDRIAACTKEFKKFGVAINEYKDGVSITGIEKLNGAEVKSYGDHRMAMALAVLGASTEGKTVIDDVECVSISFPGFFGALNQLGINVGIE